MDELKTLNSVSDEIGPILSEAEMQLLYEDFFASSDGENDLYDFDQLILDEFTDDLQGLDNSLFSFADFDDISADYKWQDVQNDLEAESVIDTTSSTSTSSLKNSGKEDCNFVKMQYIPQTNVNYIHQPTSAIRNPSRKSTCDPRTRDILKPISDLQMYSKIPDYYTAVAPQVTTSNSEDIACKENVYDRLPSYLTDFVSFKPTATPDPVVKQTAQIISQHECNKILVKRINHKDLTERPKTCDKKQEEETKLVVERRVVHVGNISRGVTREQLYTRFKVFGPIEDIKLHYRDHGDCFAFITFKYTTDAFDAVENGNNIDEPSYELSLGGRRRFCLQQYADLDNLKADESVNATKELTGTLLTKDKDIKIQNQTNAIDFDSLLKSAREKMNIYKSK